MMVVIFVNGVLGCPEHAKELALTADRIICADGGARHCLELGIVPHLVAGDMDSLGPGELERLKGMGVAMDVHPREKDQTDLAIALDHARRLAPDRIVLLGAWGGRMDHAVANLLLLAGETGPAGETGLSGESAPVFEMMEGGQVCRVVFEGQCYAFSGAEGAVVSVLPLTEKATGVTYEGLRYPLRDATLRLGSSLGMSNEMAGDRARISVRTGRLLVIRSVGTE